MLKHMLPAGDSTYIIHDTLGIKLLIKLIKSEFDAEVSGCCFSYT